MGPTMEALREFWEFMGYLDTAAGVIALAWATWLWRRAP
jgi:hypothetical protein